MNERIRQFAEQAFDRANDGTIADIKIPKEFIERFAELIVEECADLINSMDHSSQYFPHVADAIKEHFGVEA
jgi:hypothetical protein